MDTRDIAIDTLVLLEWNPQKITEHDFQGLVESIKADPDFPKARPVIVNIRTGKNVV